MGDQMLMYIMKPNLLAEVMLQRLIFQNDLHIPLDNFVSIFSHTSFQ